ncbi:MAG: hypothetical protein JO189_19505 [Deltaproteobacteria bacterium]|nr:hypothetical protein [Deltaproteobacteria bacterium]
MSIRVADIDGEVFEEAGLDALPCRFSDYDQITYDRPYHRPADLLPHNLLYARL